MKKIILNHKSYLSINEIEKYKKELESFLFKNIEVVLFPSVLYLSLFNDTKLKIGSQNFFSYNYGSYTGEISLEALKSLKINYTLVGHSERKTLGIDDYDVIKDKLFKSLNASFNTVLCVGELSKKKSSFKYIKKELDYLLTSIDHDKLSFLIIAYEPLSAIGTGETKELKEIEYIKEKTKEYFMKKYNKDIPFLYGGSVNVDNIEQIIEVTDGVLIGKISSNIEEIEKILKKVEKV